ncbi:MAG: N-acetylmuramoyl-L-alanine amidase, partial [Bacteroides sp.]|nr:N-acetylmuramoyl-L-alanine amidase [Bacteroides sp.]
MNKVQYLLIFLALWLLQPLQAQRKNAAYQAYIKEYADLAVEQMQRHKIPASITLAQG